MRIGKKTTESIQITANGPTELATRKAILQKIEDQVSTQALETLGRLLDKKGAKLSNLLVQHEGLISKL